MSSQIKPFDILNDLRPSTKIAGGVAGVALCLGASIALHSKIQDYKEFRQLKNARTRRQAERAAEFQRLQKEFPMTAEFEAIVDLPFETLRLKLQTRELSAKKAVSAFIAKSLGVTKEFNCITVYVPQALGWAAELDALPEVKGPFHGIPICVKDDTDVAGMDSSVGYSKNLNKPASESAVLVQILMDLGAVPFCRTNLPQTCVSSGSENPIYGRVLNAHNKKLSPGGSSSGTGCLVAAGGTHFGTGSDTGGSLRIPAHFNGVCTLRPTALRLSRKGLQQCIKNCIGAPSVGFVITKYPSELALIFKTITENNLQNQYDSSAMPIPWNEAMFSSEKRLRIGYYTGLTGLPILGDTEDTVLKAKAALESFGHTLVPFEMPDPVRVERISFALYFADLGKTMSEDLKNDEIAPVIQGLYDLVATPVWKRRLLTSLPFLKNIYGGLRAGLDSCQSADLWHFMAQRDILVNEMLDNMKKLNLDLLLGPAFPYPAPGIDDDGGITGKPGEVQYTAIWNLVDFPAGVLRFGTETAQHQEASSKLTHIYGRDKMTIKKAIGMPIGVQLIGKPYHEEVVLRGMLDLDKYRQINL